MRTTGGGRLEPSVNDSFETVILPHLDAAYSLACYLLRSDDDAQDVTQQACLKALTNFKSYRGENPRAWLCAIVRHTCYDWQRGRVGSVHVVEFDEQVHGGMSSEDPADVAMIRSANRAAVRSALDALPAEFREVIVLREMEGLSYREIAALVNVPIGTVMSRLARARKRLAQILGTREQP